MNRSLDLRFNFQVLSKVFFAIYLAYSNVLRYSVINIRGLSEVLLIIAIAAQLIHERFRLRLDKSLLALIVFALYVFLSGFLVAQDFDRLLSSLLTFVECILVFYLVICYIAADGKPDFPMIAFIGLALITTFFLIFRGVGLKRINIADTVNVNAIGVTLSFAIGFVLYLLISKGNSPIKWVIGITSIAILLVGVMMTASKKAIISGAALIILWIFLCYRFTFARIPLALRFAVFGGIIAAGILVYRWYTSSYAQQMEYMINRMSGLYVGESDQARIEMIKEGLLIFVSHPIFGVGFNNARYYISYATYTHCFYAEMLACTGIIGTILFGYAMIRPWAIIVKTRRRIRLRDSLQNTKIIYMLAVFIVFLLLNFTQIAFYAQNLMYVFSVFSAFAICLDINNKRMGVENEKD